MFSSAIKRRSIPDKFFYQRALIGSLDQLVEQAEKFLGEKSLLSYYDEIALSGLKLAQLDVRRGVHWTPTNLK